jgi:SAM-dependent methyltransferase
MRSENERRARRWREEQDFHDRWAASVRVEELDVPDTFAGVTDPENRCALLMLGDLGGRRVLDLGCGFGAASSFFALRGAAVVGVDISQMMLCRARSVADRCQVAGRFRACRAAVEYLPMCDDSFDLVYGYGILHHADLRLALQEVRRVLRPGGRAVLVEPLGVNPVVNIYRLLSRDVRTSGERPLMPRDLRTIASVFPRFQHREVQLLSLLIHVWMAITGRFRLKTDRPWKMILDQWRRYAPVFALLQRLDSRLLRMVPPLGLLSWATVLVMDKPCENAALMPGGHALQRTRA